MKRIIAILAFLTTLASLSYASDFSLYQRSGHRSAKWNGMVEAGFSSFDSDDFSSAIVFLEKAYQMGCRDGLLLFKIGLYYELRKNYRDALKYMTQASSKLSAQYPNYPETRRIHEHLGRLYYQTDQFDKALPELEAALKNSPDDFTLLFMSGQIYRLQKRYEEAISNFEKALAIISAGVGKGGDESALAMATTKITLTELMSLYYELKDYPKSLKCAEMILTMSPNEAIALSYKRDIETRQFKQREQEAIRKIIE